MKFVKTSKFYLDCISVSYSFIKHQLIKVKKINVIFLSAISLSLGLKNLRKQFVISSLVLLSSNLFYINDAFSSCEKSDLISHKLISDICWDCVLPIIVAQTKLGSSSNSWIPDRATSKYLCSCQNAEGLSVPGIATSFWEPARLVEFETVPGCLSVLNTKLTSNMDHLDRGTHGIKDKRTGDRSFFHYHYYAFPLLEMLSLFTSGVCNSDGYHDLDIMYFSELDPTWNDDTLAFFTNPESALIANPIAAASCSADAVLSFSHNPIDNLFWCAGSWGHLYPLSGYVFNPTGTIKTTSLLAARVLAALHRRGVAHRTMGSDAMCKGVVDPMLPKSQYRFSLVWPVPETSKAHGFGESTLSWGISRSIPVVGEHPIYLVWRWQDCCNTISLGAKR